MQLKFKAKGNLLVSEPGAPYATGQPARYVGRKSVLPVTKTLADGKVVTLKPGSYPAVEEPYVVDSETKEGRRLVKLTRRDKCLWPGDKETAKACGVPLVATKFDDGAWVPAAKAPLKKDD